MDNINKITIGENMKMTKDERKAEDERVKKYLRGRVVVPSRTIKGKKIYHTEAVNPVRRKISDMAASAGMTRKQYKKYTKSIRAKILKGKV